ncbi:putative transposase [Acidiphilium sp. JA12-A1]|nr:putative transposase [Acidiphilium sp. JA12-A1]
MGKHITFIGLDVHKETITVALAESGGRDDVREYGRIANTPEALTRVVTKLQRVGGELRFCYEAGPCGYGIQRQLTAAGHDCVVVAPSLIPRKAGGTDQDGSSGCGEPGQAASGGGIDGGLGAGSGA